MIEKLLRLLRQIDEDIARGDLFSGAPTSIYVIGGAAIALGIDATATTTDIDITDVEGSRMTVLGQRYGKASDAPSKFGVYLEVVNDSFALLPPTEQYRRRAVEIDAFHGKRLRVFRLAAADLIIAKIKRFSPRDRRDIQTIIDRTLEVLDAEDLSQRLESLSMYVHDEMDDLRARLLRVIDFLNGNTNQI